MLALSALTLSSIALCENELTVVAGGGVGDGDNALNAALGGPRSLAVAPDGRLFVFDAGHLRIRQIDLATGKISTVPGTIPRYPGREARDSSIGYIGDIAIDGRGSLYVYDMAGSRVIRVQPNTGQRTALMEHVSWSRGIGLDEDGNVFLAESGRNRILRWDARTGSTSVVFQGEDGGLRVRAGEDRDPSNRWTFPIGPLAVDANGLIYFIDDPDKTIFRVDSRTGHAEPFLTDAEVEGNKPTRFVDLAFDPAGRLFVSDFNNGRVLRLDPATKKVSAIFAGGDLPVSPLDLAVGPGGEVYVSDRATNRVQEVCETEGRSRPIAGTGLPDFGGDGGPATEAAFSEPMGLAISSGDLYVADSYNRRLRAVAKDGTVRTVVGGGEDTYWNRPKPPLSVKLVGPRCVAATGETVFVSFEHDAIFRLAPAGGLLELVVQGRELDKTPRNTYPGSPAVTGLSVGPDQSLYVLIGNQAVQYQPTDRSVRVVAGTGRWGFGGDGGSAYDALLKEPSGIAVDGSGNVFIADRWNQRVRRVDARTGMISTFAGTGVAGKAVDGICATDSPLDHPTGVAVDSRGNVYVTDSFNYRVRKIDADTGLISTIGPPDAEFRLNGGLAVDPVGNVYVSDPAGRRVVKIPVAESDGAESRNTISR